ncbi:3-oxoadipate enol-lactone hydrolase [Parafrankia colletiae]|uniref:3-oxoadipate enol-lactone hydrolase n=2 Tax=Parafrankia colletiae TaxID=573497 RepID=A0A1S1QWD7_9ACTN|nr:3-oxoadipate enol-lactone hydrolase [Parafrankia colletiae]
MRSMTDQTADQTADRPADGTASEAPVDQSADGAAGRPAERSAVRRICVAAGLDLHVEDLHPAAVDTTRSDPTPVVLVHGIAGTTADWARVAPELATTRRVIAYDHRGHGASDRAAGGRPSYTFDLLLADLVALLDTLGLRAVDLVGHSMGGVVALRYVLDHPERVRSLVLVDTAAEPASATGGAARRVVSALLEGAAAIATAVHGAHDPEPAADGGPSELAVVDERAGAAERHGSAADHQVEGLGRIDPEALVAFGRELGAYPSMVDRLGEIGCPTTVIVGERDSSLRDSAHTLARAVSRAHLAVIAGADHSPHASRPLAWLAAVERHFGRLAADLAVNLAADKATAPGRSAYPSAPLRPFT